MTTLLSIKNLSINFYTREKLVRAVNDVSLDLHEGETLGIVGEAGAGKSVLSQGLLNVVMRPGKIDSGSILFHDRDLLKMNEDEIRPIRGNQISIVASHPKSALNPMVTIGNQIANAYQAHCPCSKKEALEASVAALRSVGINDPEARMKAYPHELSGGMAQRVVVAIALLHTPQVLIADEPTAGLDVTIQRQVLEMINELIEQKNMGTIISTRDMGIIAHYCRKVAVLQQGRIVEFADVEELFNNAMHPYTRRLLDSATLGRIKALSNQNENRILHHDSHKADIEQLFCEKCMNYESCPDAQLIEVLPEHWLRCHK